MNRNTRILVFFGWMFFTSLTLLSANPSTKTPERLLKFRAGEKVNGDYLATDYESISQRYAKAKATSDELWTKLQAKKLALGDVGKVGPQVLLINALRREAEFLQLRGEAGGWDLNLRVVELDSRLFKVVRELLLLPGLNLNTPQQQLQRAHAAGMKRLPQIEMLKSQKKFGQAEGELYEILDDMSKSAVWFPTSDFSSLFKPFVVPIEEARQHRRDQAVTELQAIIARGPDLAKIQSELTQAAALIGSSGSATWNGKMLTGPQLVTEWQENWPKLQAATKRSLMAQWQIEQIAGGEAKYVNQVTAQQQFAQAVPRLLAAIIQADTNRAVAVDAANLYPQYLSACAALCAVGPRQDLESAFNPVLSALATKAGLDSQVAAHRTAMEPLLGWKRFLARGQAKSLAANHEPAHAWCTKHLGKPFQEHTIMPNPQTDISRAQVGSSADLVLPAAIPAGPAPTVVVSDVVPVSVAGQRSVGRYQQRMFALVGSPPKEALMAATEQLQQQLLGTPLSLDAATVLASARLGVFEKAGGTLDQVTIEPLLTRFVTLPDEAGTMLPLGVLPAEAFDPAQNNKQGEFLSVRCDVLQPKWLQHECFVIQP